jgi:glycosyltransferase involved in cell wall biosynthesis
VDLEYNARCLSSPPEAPGPTHGRAGPCVAILLSTFNGERYLGEQLRSYVAQTHGNWRLYWRDDGSADRGPDMMAAFGQDAGYGRCIRLPEDGNLRPTRSFFTLLSMALLGDASFFAFSDQDDVWLPDKLAHAVEALNQVSSGRPALYFCGRMPVDQSLRPIGRCPALRRPPGFPAALIQNVIPGCCMTLNRAAAELISAAGPPDGTWHDWWCYLVVSAQYGVVFGGDRSDILYRQHGGNLVGEPLRFWRRGVAAMRRGRHPFLRIFWGHVGALQACTGLFPDRTRTMLATIVEAAHGGLAARVRALFIPGLVRQTWMETLVFRLWFLLG